MKYSICSILLVFAMAVSLQSPVFAALTNDFIEESEGKKKEAEENQKAIQGKLSQVKQMLKEVQNIKSELDKAMVEADAKLEDLNDSIEILNADIIELEDNIATTQAELVVAKSVKEKQYYTMKKRIQYMYEKGNKSYIELLFTSGSFSDFLNTAEFVNKISKYDKEMLNSYMDTVKDIEEKEQKLLEEETRLKEKQSDLNAQQDEVENEMEEKQDAINMYTADINNKEAAIQEYEAYIAEQKAVVEALEAAILAEKKRLAEENKSSVTYDGGKFAWPAPKYVRISDEYGNRTHPILGTQQFHNGIDLAAPGGSPILAAYDGEVVAADYSATMGNYVMINHGDGLITIYMHASALEVSKGQMVVRGEEIAKVGSTGRSTGNHLHFSVRENGSYVSPWKFIS
ncbi:MAG: peptidoglycan DD-metalloendopeptidase family protein [Lachnospiraceae bacterium]|nr:peptidoglycan DD-metalloendopeptidase family protein [Lachnospiraceae bacterium]